MRVHNWNSRKAFNHRVINEHVKTFSNIAANFTFKLFLRYLRKKEAIWKHKSWEKQKVKKMFFPFSRAAKRFCISALKFTIYLEKEKKISCSLKTKSGKKQ